MEDLMNAGGDAAAQDNAATIEDNAEGQASGQAEGDQGKPKTGDPKIDDPWPKQARNAISRRDKQIGAMRAEIAELRRQHTQSQQAVQKPAAAEPPKEPKEEDYSNYGEYLKALARHTALQGAQPQREQVDPQKLQEQARKEAVQEVYYNNRVEAVAQQAAKAVQEIPELGQMLEEFGDILDTYPPHIEMAFLEASNAPLAFYALAKEGKLEALATMTPSQAANVIAHAQIRGEQLAKASKVSKAPQPIAGARGNSPAGKAVESMSGDEILKSIRGK